ncbi:E3 ubiquitin-protein ligase RNF25 [Amia ocellicauda]|uniref:E3 ubiquitin-protein ligase RNF25 n=1 Tax=Amia ocellicauda TaxID=2972642 RepID=UPI003463F4BA
MAAESCVDSEIEVLQSIYLDELTVTHQQDSECPWLVSITLYPSTAQDCDSQYVRLTLSLALSPQYPVCPPRISIHNPRGLSDDKLQSVQQCLQSVAWSSVGAPVLYELIEKAKEILTDSNIPHGHCVICLYDFKEGEVFTKTQCYHYFHSHCLGRYATHSESELRHRLQERKEDKTLNTKLAEELTVVCPVCREPLAYDLEVLQTSPAPHFPSECFSPGVEFQKQWVDLRKVLERQRQRGGVIDPEAERNKFLIHIHEAPADGSPAHDPSSESPPSSLTPSAPLLHVQSQHGAPPPHQSQHRGGRMSHKPQNRPRTRDKPTMERSSHSQGRGLRRTHQSESRKEKDNSGSQWESGDANQGSQSETRTQMVGHLEQRFVKLSVEMQGESEVIVGNGQLETNPQEACSLLENTTVARDSITQSDGSAGTMDSLSQSETDTETETKEMLSQSEQPVNREGLRDQSGVHTGTLNSQSEARMEMEQGPRLTDGHSSQRQRGRRPPQVQWDCERRWGRRREFPQSQAQHYRGTDQSEAQQRRSFHQWESGGGRTLGQLGSGGWNNQRRGGGASRRKGRGLEQRGGERERRSVTTEKE